jgi:hypothetical protein
LPASRGPRPWSLGITDHCTPRLFGGGDSVRADPDALSRCANRVERGPGPQYQVEPRAKSELIELLSRVRKLPGISSDTPQQRAQGGSIGSYRLWHKGGVHGPGLGRFWASRQLLTSRIFAKKELVYTAPGKELKWWRPTPEALLALGLRCLLRYSGAQGAGTLL